jgi:hypothetical protein
MPSYLTELTWEEFIDKAEFGESDMPATSRHSRSNGRESFYGKWNLKQACELARTGWAEGLEAIKPRVEKISEMIALKRFKKEIAYSQMGPGTWDMGRLIQGHPQPWVTFVDSEDVENGQTNGGVVSISFNATVYHGRSVDHIFNKGALVVALVDMLESAGTRVELNLVYHTKMDDYGIPVVVRVKDAQEIVDMDRIAFALANSACFRRMGFSIYEQAPEIFRTKCDVTAMGGYGLAAEYDLEDSINIRSNDLFSMSEDEQLEWLKLQLEEHGVEVVDD